MTGGDSLRTGQDSVMRELKKEEIEYAISRLEVHMASRGLNQSDLDELTGVEQSTISPPQAGAQLRKPAEAVRRPRPATRGRVEGCGGPLAENPSRLSGDAANGPL